MKNILSICICLLATYASSGQKTNETVPTAVTDSFKQRFPDIDKVKWEKENDQEWEATFKKENVEYSANFENDGTWKETEHEIETSELPAKLANIIQIRFENYKIKEAEISETKDGLFYELELKSGSTKIEILGDTEGNIIEKPLEK